VSLTDGAIAYEALRIFDIEPKKVEFIRHNENLVYRVWDEEESYLLRIHTPASQNFVGYRQQQEYIEAELAWLGELGQDPRLAVQKAIKNSEGVTVSALEHGGQLHYCTLLTWIEGHVFDPAKDESKAEQVAELIDILHSCSQPRKKLVRPSYDAAHFREVVEKLKPAVDLGFLSCEDFKLMERVCESILLILPNEQGMIHADLGPGNIIVHENGLSPIDFSLCGYGPLLWDIGGMLVAYPKEIRRNIFDRYNDLRPISIEGLRLCDGLAILSILSCWAFHISNPAQHEWLQRRMPKSVQNEWLKFERGEGLLFEI